MIFTDKAAEIFSLRENPPRQNKKMIPFYSSIQLCGHLACAFVAAMLSGSALFVVSLFFERSGAFERSYAFALMASALVWVLPILLDISSGAREIVVYACFAACLVALKCVFGKSARESIWFSAAFVLSQAAVFLMAYEKVIL